MQIDAPQYAGLLDPAIRAGYQRRGSDPDRLLDRCIELDNAVIGGSGPGITFGLHLCRGNNDSKFYASGGYDPIAGRVFRGTSFQRFLLEYDDARSGGFEPLRHVPDDRGRARTRHDQEARARERRGHSSAGSARPRSSCRSSASRSRRSAASPRPCRGTA